MDRNSDHLPAGVDHGDLLLVLEYVLHYHIVILTADHDGYLPLNTHLFCLYLDRNVSTAGACVVDAVAVVVVATARGCGAVANAATDGRCAVDVVADVVVVNVVYHWSRELSNVFISRIIITCCSRTGV